MEWKDVDALIKKVAKENYIWPIDMGVEFLLRRRNLFVGTNRDVDPALEECLMQLAREHPLRLHSELGIKYYLQLIEMSAERRQEQWIQKLLDQGNVRGGDARVIPIVMALAKKHPGMFTPKHMITLLEINERFPQVAGIWECFRNHPELLFAAIYDAHGDWGNVDICKDLVSGMCDIGGDRLKEWVETRILPRLLMKFQQEEKAELSDWKLYSTLAEILPHEVFDNHFEEYISIEDDQEYSFDLLNKFTTPVIFHQMLLLADRQDSRAEIFRNFLINRRARAFCSGQNILCSHDEQRASFLSDLWKIVNGIEHV